MKKHTTKIIIYFSAAALIGLVITQLFWIRNAVNLAEEQFDHRVSEALQDVMAELPKYSKESCKTSCIYSCPSNRNQMLEIINPSIMDSLLRVHFEYYELGTEFEYAIVNCQSDSIIYQKSDVISEKISTKKHKKGLTCFEANDMYTLEVYFPKKREQVLKELSFWLILSIVFLLIVLFSFIFNTLTIFRQKKISQIKNDFINNMTHEFKTPISTISMASEVLMNAEGNTLHDRVKTYSKVIFDENQRLKLQVEQVLQTAIIDKGEIKLKKESIGLHNLLEVSVTNHCFEQCEKEVKMNYQLDARNDIIKIDKMHMSNVINNLLDNAYKYGGEKPEITISSASDKHGLTFSIQDNGLGISTANQKQIFDKFYRVSTGDVHDVKGFGLGLFYVKSIIDAHNGTIKVKSELGKGSTFEIFLPFN